MSSSEHDVVYYEGKQVSLAKLVGAAELLYTNDILFTRPRWIADDEVKTCCTCDARFTAVKRKHHCRSCGRVCCHQCCKDKVPLPHLGYIDAERVCKDCKHIVHLLYIAFNTAAQLSERQEAARGLAAMFQTPGDAQLLLELGGVQALVFLSKIKDTKIRGTVIECLQGLSQDPVLHPYLVENQVLAVVCRFLDDTHPQEHQMMVHCISILTHFCKDEQLGHAVLDVGGLEVLLQLSRTSSSDTSSNQNTVSLLALQCLSLLLEHPSVCEVLYNSKDVNIFARIMALVQSADEKVEEICLHMLANISTISDRQRQRIIQEDMYTAGVVCRVLRSSPTNIQVLINAACLVANLAAMEFTQSSLTDHLGCLCALLARYPDHTALLMEVGRAMVNLSAYANNTTILMEHLTDICKTLLCSTQAVLNERGMLIVLNLFSHSPEETVNVILKCSARQFLQTIAGNTALLNAMRLALSQSHPTAAKPIRASFSHM